MIGLRRKIREKENERKAMEKRGREKGEREKGQRGERGETLERED